MDPSIMKLLEEDEDETMHSGADLDAFTAALNRDIEGDTSASQPSDSESAALSQGNNHTSSQLFQQWQNSNQEGNGNSQVQDSMDSSQRQHMLSSEMDVKPQVSGMDYQLQHVDSSQGGNGVSSQQKQQQDDRQQRQMGENTHHYPQTLGLQNSEQNPGNLQEPDRTQNSQGESQYQNLQSISNQRAMAPERAMNQMNRSGTQVPFALLLPVIIPQLDKDRAMQLNTLYQRLKKNEVSKDEFVRQMRSIVGDHMLKMAVYKLQMQTGGRPNQFLPKPQASAQPAHLKGPPAGSHQGAVPQSLAQLHQKAQLNNDSSNAMTEGSGQKFREVGRNSDSHGVPASLATSSGLSNMNQERMPISTQGLTKQQQQHLHFSQPSFPMYGSSGGNYHPFSGSATTSLKQPPHDAQMRQGPIHQGMTQAQMVASAQAMNAAKFDRPNSFGEQKRVQGGTIPHVTNSPTLPQSTVHWPSSITKEQKNSAPSLSAYVKPEPVDQENEQQLKSQLSSSKELPSFSPFPFEHGKEDGTETHASRTGFSASTGSMPSNSAPSSITAKLEAMNTRIPSTNSAVTAGNNSKTPPKKPSVGQKKPLETLGSSPPLPSKKQKVGGAFSDQSIEQLNDVTAVSGVNLREEEEQLLSGPKEDSRISEASRRVVQEEEERLLLQKSPLQKKLAEIMSKCGLKNVSNDVERCLSLCVEERMRGLVSNLIRLSKQRVDIEKPRHRTLITSDVRQQIMAINRKAREELEKKQAEAEKLQKLNDPEGDGGADGDKDKDDGRAKSLKANKEEDDKMRTTAANVAARAAVGGDDMLSKWQLMAEQARQKRGGSEVPSGSQPSKDGNHKSSSTSSTNGTDNQEGERRGTSNVPVISGSGKLSARSQLLAAQAKPRPTISVKDVIAVLEREPQMSKTTLMYRLYEKVRSDVAAVAE